LLDQIESPVAEPELLPVFRSVPPSVRDGLLADAIQHAVAPGTVLFEQGETPPFQLIVMTGSVQLFGVSSAKRQVLIEVVRAPDLIIPAAVVSGAPYLMQARVPEHSRLLMIPAARFRAAVSSDLALAQAVIGSLAHQFRRMVRQVKNLKLRSSTERVGFYILTLSRRQATPDRAKLPYGKHLIASELGITRESFSRALAALEESGIEVEGDVILIKDADGLARACLFDPVIDQNDG